MMSSRKVYRCKHCKKMFLTAVDLCKHKKVDHVEEVRQRLRDSQQGSSSSVSTSRVPERLTANLNGKYTVVVPHPGNDSSDSEDDCRVVQVQLDTPKPKTLVIADVCGEASDVDSVSTELLDSDGHPSPMKAVDSHLHTNKNQTSDCNKDSSLQEEGFTQETDKEATEDEDVEVITLDDSDSDDGITSEVTLLSEKHPAVEFEKVSSPVSPKLPNFVPERMMPTTSAVPNSSGKTDVVIVDLDAESLNSAQNEECNVTTSDIDENQNSRKAAAEEAKDVPRRKKGRFSDTGRDADPAGSSCSSEDEETRIPIQRPERVPRTPEGLINTGGRLNCRFCGMPFRPIDYRRHADICSRNAKKIKTNMDRFLRLL